MKRPNPTPEELARYHANAVARAHVLERELVRLAVAVEYDLVGEMPAAARAALNDTWPLIDADGQIRARNLRRIRREEADPCARQ